MRILIAGACNTNVQFLRLREEGEKRGYVVKACPVSDVSISKIGERVEVAGDNLASFDLIRFQSISKNPTLWRIAIDQALQMHIPIIDEKWFIKHKDEGSAPYMFDLAEHGIRIPKTEVINCSDLSQKGVLDFSEPFILRTFESRKGRGVGLIKTENDVHAFIKEQGLEPQKQLMVREFIPNNGDLRLFVIDGDVVGAMKRTPKNGEFRANISQGGTGSIFDLTDQDEIRNMAIRATELCGFDIAGVDIIIHKQTRDPYLLEVNRSPQIEGMEKFTGLNIASSIIDFFEQIYRDST